MKKRLFLLLFVFFVPNVVYAIQNLDEHCKVVSGNGKDIGSEIACGTEHFYIVENKDGMIKMLAKYNLNVGDKIDYFDLEGNKPSYSNGDFIGFGEEYCKTKAIEKGYSPYYAFPMGPEPVSDQLRVVNGCRVYEKLDPEHIQQDERAIGTKLDGNGKSILPLYGITYMNPYWGYDAIVNNHIVDNDYDSNGDLIIERTVFEGYLNGYKAELQRQGIGVSDVSFITLNKSIELLRNVSNKEVEVVLDYLDPSEIGDMPYSEDEIISVQIGKMDINQYVPANQKWIYGVTYWLGSGFKVVDSGTHEYNDYYITNEGMLCALGRGQCSNLVYPIGNGVRPLVTIYKDNLLYLIKTVTDGHGTIEVVDNSFGGETIQFRVNSNKGYKLSKLIITSDSGERVEFSEGEIINNFDGTISIDKNKFTMPFENVTMEARWVSTIVNPETGRSLIFLGGLLLIGILIVKGFFNKDKNNLFDHL